jgi:hypothetical protein
MWGVVNASAAGGNYPAWLLKTTKVYHIEFRVHKHRYCDEVLKSNIAALTQPGEHLLGSSHTALVVKFTCNRYISTVESYG